MTCARTAEEQFVFDDINTGIKQISGPLCEPCSCEAQPAETISVFPLYTHPRCACVGCGWCKHEDDDDG